MSTAYETAAAALDTAAKALRAVAAEANPFKVGDIIDTTKLGDLPVGLVFTDRDGDRYEVTGVKSYVWASSREDVGLSPENYSPLTVVEVPKAETPAPAAPAAPQVMTLADFKVGDRVRATGISIWGTNCNGKVGTVRRIDTLDRAVAVRFDRTDGDKMYRAASLTKIESEHPIKVGDKVKVTDGINAYRGFVGKVGTVTKVEVGIPYLTSTTGNRYTINDSFFAGAVEKVTEPAAPLAPTTRNITSGRNELLAEHSYSENGAFIRLAERTPYSGSNVAAVHLTKQQTVDLIATLQAIVDRPRSGSSAW